MKKILALVLALVMVLAFTACGEGSTGSNTPEITDEVVKLTVWVGDNYANVTQQMVESFKAQYPEQKFDITIGIESESTCKDTVLNDPEAAADVFTFADDQLNELVNAGALLPVQVNLEQIKEENSAASIDCASKDGTLYAYPMSASNGYFLYYDATFFSEEDVQSLNTMVDKAAAAGKSVGMQFGTDGGWYIYSFFKGAGLNMSINADGLTNNCDWNNATGEAVCQGILDLVATGGFVADSTANLVSRAASGEVVALVDGTWDSVAIQEAYGEGYACAKLPTYNVNGTATQMASFSGYKLVGVNTYSQQAGWAMLLAQWLTNEENQMLRFNDQGDGPSNIKAAANEAVLANAAISALAAQGQFATAQRVGGNYWSSAATLGAILSQGNPDGTPLSELLETAVSGIIS